MLSYLNRSIRSVISAQSSRLLIPLIKNQKFLSFYLGQRHVRNSREEPETFFITSNKKRIPVYRGYRYSVKQGWKYFDSLRLLSQIKECGFLSNEDQIFLQETVGHRTLTRSISEVKPKLDMAVSRNKDLFVTQSLNKETVPILKLSQKNVVNKVKFYCRAYRKMFNKLKKLQIYEKTDGNALLEIGFISGGYSLFAFEKLGFQVFGVDNYYGELIIRRY